ncbi:MAG: hypothetical protein FJ317_08615 [SAR202 cluster bacterium]|nr:hypothetical protein [SAR202 cluster bacterium]
MAKSKLSGKVQTVLGPIEPDQLGITLTHEHLLIDLGCYFKTPEEASERAWINAPLTMDKLGKAAPRWSYTLHNQQLLDEKVAIEEVMRFKLEGGGSLVEATSIGIARDPLAWARISRATGLNVIMGASHYVPVSYPAGIDKRSEDEITAYIVRDVTVGVGDTGVRSGIIGEVGNFWPSDKTQDKVLRASARAQKETGAPILIHPGFAMESPPHILNVLSEAGADLSRVIMGHLDIFADRAWFKDLASSGCYMEFDNWGFEDTTAGSVAHQSIAVPSDVQRMEMYEFLLDQGFGEKLVVAQDVCFKMQYARYGGKSYDHILGNLVPRMRKRGWSDKQINDILVENPKRVLTFK